VDLSDALERYAPGSPNPEYFYLELPIPDSVSTKRRFVYVKEDGEYGQDRAVFPMHFGLEVRIKGGGGVLYWCTRLTATNIGRSICNGEARESQLEELRSDRGRRGRSSR
jgi:hypothetical protein